MKYWIFENNQVLGPYEPEDLGKNASFTADSLVCPEGRRGTNIGDWHRAGMITELASVVSRLNPPAKTAPPITYPGATPAPRSESSSPEPTLRDLTQLASLQEKMSNLEDVVTKLQTGLRAKDSEVAALNQVIGQKELETSRIKRESEATKQLAEKFKLSTEELKMKLSSMEGRLAAVLRLNETIDKALAAEKQVENNIATHGETLADLTREIESLKTEMRTRAATESPASPPPAPLSPIATTPPSPLYQPGSPEADMLSELTREIDALKTQIQGGEHAGSLGVKPAAPIFTAPPTNHPVPAVQKPAPPPFIPPAPPPVVSPKNPPPTPTNTEVVEQISATVQEAGKTAWPPPSPPVAPLPAHVQQFEPLPLTAFNPNDPLFSAPATRAAQLFSDGRFRFKILGGLMALFALGVGIVIGPQFLKRPNRSHSSPGDDAPVEIPGTTKPTDGGASTSPEPEVEEPTIHAPQNEAARLAAINTAKEYALPTGKTLGQTLETMAPPSGNLPPWMADLLTNGHYDVNFFARGTAGTPTVVFEFEVDPSENMVIGRNSAAKAALLGRPIPPPPAKVKPAVKVKIKQHVAPKPVPTPIPEKEESLDTLLGSVGVPTEQVNVDSTKSYPAPTNSTHPPKSAKKSLAKRAAKAAKSPVPTTRAPSVKPSDEALLDDLLKE